MIRFKRRKGAPQQTVVLVHGVEFGFIWRLPFKRSPRWRYELSGPGRTLLWMVKAELIPFSLEAPRLKDLKRHLRQILTPELCATLKVELAEVQASKLEDYVVEQIELIFGDDDTGIGGQSGEF